MIRSLFPNVVRRSFVLKFAIVFAVLGLLVASVGVAATTGIRQDVEASTHAEQTELAQREARNVENWNDRNEAMLEVMAQSKSFRTGEAGTVQSVIDEMEPKLPVEKRSLHYVDAGTGAVTASTNEQFRGRSLSAVEAPWTADIGGGATDTVVTDAYRAGPAEDGAPLVAYVTPVDGRTDRFVVYTVDLNAVSAQFGSEDEATSTVLVDEDGETVFGDRQDPLSTYVPSDSPTFERLRSDESGAFEVRNAVDGGTNDLGAGGSDLVAHSNVRDLGWTVVVTTATSDAYGLVDRVETYGGIATIVIVLLVGFVGAGLGYNTSRAIDGLRRKAERMEAGDLNVTLESNRVDDVGRLYESIDSMRTTLREQIREAESAREEAEIARKRTAEINAHLEQKAEDYSEVMAACGDGDLTRRMDPESQNESMTEIAKEFNRMITEIANTVDFLKDFSEEVATASEDVTTRSEEVRNASRQVTESIQEISRGARRQNEKLRIVNEEMESLSGVTQQIVSSSTRVADAAEQTAEVGREGQANAEEAMRGLDDIETESSRAVEEMRDLEAKMDDIDDLVDFIVQIADRTNMLALNANIEASRSSAGDSEGFGVVAEEVKSLAEEAKGTAESIEDEIEAIKQQASAAADGVERTSARIAEHTESIETAIEALDEIADYAEETNQGMQRITAATQQQAASTQEVLGVVEGVAGISEETTARSEDVAAAAEEQTSALDEMSDGASDLAARANRLSELLDEFTTGRGGSATAPDGTAGVAVDPEFEDETAAEPGDPDGEPSDVEAEDPAVDGADDASARPTGED